MEVTLTIEGKEKKFSSGKVYFEALIDLIELKTRIDIDKLDKKEDIDEFVTFISHDVFHDQFTPEQFKQGLDVTKWFDTLFGVLSVVQGVLPEAETEEEKN